MVPPVLLQFCLQAFVYAPSHFAGFTGMSAITGYYDHYHCW
jgi:hypothetical protein